MPLSSNLRSNLDELQRWAQVQDEGRFLLEVGATNSSNQTKRALFSSLQCPAELVSDGQELSQDAVRLLRQLKFISFDFDASTSQDEQVAVNRCRAALRSNDANEARELWEKLLSLVQKYSGGYIDQARLVAELRGHYELRPWPDYTSDLEALSHWTQAQTAAILDTIGLMTHSPRQAAGYLPDCGGLRAAAFGSPLLKERRER